MIVSLIFSFEISIDSAACCNQYIKTKKLFLTSSKSIVIFRFSLIRVDQVKSINIKSMITPLYYTIQRRSAHKLNALMLTLGKNYLTFLMTDRIKKDNAGKFLCPECRQVFTGTFPKSLLAESIRDDATKIGDAGCLDAGNFKTMA